MGRRDEEKRRRRRHRLQRQQRGPARHDGGPPGEFLEPITHALASPVPVDLLLLASTLLAATEEGDPEAGGVPWADLLESFIGVGLPETSALLAAFAQVGPDELSRRRCAAEVARRRAALPGWLDRLGEARVTDLVWLTDATGDVDHYCIEVTLATGETVSAMLLVNRTAAHGLQDAHAGPGGVTELLAVLEAEPGAAGKVILHRPDAATTRAQLTHIIDQDRRRSLVLDEDTWPACRALVEWAVRLLPEGGEWTLPELSEQDSALLADSFMASSHAAELPAQARDVALDLGSFASLTDGDLLRWSARKVAFLLGHAWLLNVSAGIEYHELMPDVLRAHVRWAGEVNRTPQWVVDEALAEIDEWEDDFFYEAEQAEYEGGVLTDMIGSLARRVGGADALETLDTTPLPDEDLDLTGVPGDVHAKVSEISARMDAVITDLFDVEMRTAGRRLLAQVAAGNPGIFRRKASSMTAACALAAMVATENDALSASAGVLAKDLAGTFGLKAVPYQRVDTMRAALGTDAFHADGYLGRPELLTSSGRTLIILSRDMWRERLG